jgi:hypothetical protein
MLQEQMEQLITRSTTNPEHWHDLSSSQVRSFTTTIDPIQLVTWMPLFQGQMINLHAALEPLFTTDHEVMGTVMASNAQWTAMDRWLARNIFVCLEPSAERVIAFKDSCSRQPAMLSSGAAIFGALRKMQRLQLGPQVRQAEHDYNSKVFFTMGMKEETVTLRASTLTTMYERLPEYKGPVSVLHAIIKKLPTRPRRRSR